ncbi:MAG: glycosyltransferase family 4 protein [Candidatus Obscuribacterales bacterium]|nr:glycosyltransferase family 4 protein [Candidatus Obscuribacterales bacterium]
MISREYPPDTGWGGIATFANHLAQGLKELGHEVEVIALAKDKAKTVEQDGIKIHRVEPHQIYGDLGAVSICMPYSRYVIRVASALWQKFIQLHEEKPFDVVDTPELLAEGLVPSVTKAVPMVVRLYTPHSKFIAEGLHNVSPNFDHQFVAMLERMAMISADVITSPSEDLADFVSRDMAYPRERITIVRNPIDPDKFSPEGPKALDSNGKLTVLFVGRLEERKGIGDLVNAIPKVISKFSNVRFVIIGDDTNNAKGQRSVLAELQDSLRANGCAEHVQFINRVPLAELPSYYRSADISIVPSVYDNSPYTCLEAMSCGLPVIGTSGGGTKEYIVDGESGIIIPPRNPEAIADSLLKLLQDETERKRLSLNARKRVLDEFQRKEIAAKTVALYEQAGRIFAAKYPARLYLKPLEQALPDADVLLYSFDKMLYDLLYLKSYSFRLKHWGKLFLYRPRLSLMKSVVSMWRALRRLVGREYKDQPKILARLENEILVRQYDPINRPPEYFASSFVISSEGEAAVEKSSVAFRSST